MKKLIFFCLFLILVCGTSTVFAAPPSEDYQLLLADEFSGDALDTDLWDYRSGAPYGGKNLIENVRVKDGMLYLDYRKVDGVYTGGGVLTNFNLPYGYYETRAKIYGGTGGLHSSFWISGGNAFTTRPLNYPPNNTILEIDGFEIDSHAPERLSHGTIYWWNEREGRFRDYYSEQDLSADYFVMGMEWLPDRVSFYLDGKLLNTDDALTVYGPGYLWLTAVATPESRMDLIDDTKADETGYFGSSEYDYFRYYQMPLKNENLLGNGNFEYDRTTDSLHPFCFITKGDTSAAMPIRSGEAYEGMNCLRHASAVPYEVSSGQEFKYLVSGNYTFSGNFKGTGDFTKARMVIYAKDGSVIAEKTIPAAREWISLSLQDVYIDGYAYVAIESASDGNTDLLIDNLSFYTTDGKEYATHNSPDYLLYTKKTSAFINAMRKESLISYTEIIDKSDGWDDNSSLTVENMWAGINNYAVWEIPITEDNEYHLDIHCLYANNNAQSMQCTVWVNDGEKTVHLVPTNTGESYYYALGNHDLKNGDTLYVRVDCTHAMATRLSHLSLSPVSDYHAYSSLSFMPDEPAFLYRATLYDWGTLYPYKQDGKVYLPYQKLSEVLGLDLDIETDYIDEGVLTANTPYRLIDAGDTLLLTESEEDFDTKFISLCRMEIQRAHRSAVPQSATLSAETAADATVYEFDDGFKTGKWVYSNLDSGSYYTTERATVLWECIAPQEGTFTLQFRSVGHENSTPLANINVLTDKKMHSFTIDQKVSETGWYDVGTYSLKANEKVVFSLTNKAGYNCLRAKQVRLVPIKSPAALFKGTEADETALVIPFSEAETTGEWAKSSIGDSYTASATDAKAVFTATVPESGRYSVQIYSVLYENGPTNAVVTYNRNTDFSLHSVNQQTDETGWYEVANEYLNSGDTVSVAISKLGGGYLRAKAMRLVPIPAEIAVYQSDKDVILSAKDNALSCTNVLLGEYDQNGFLVGVKSQPATSPVQFVLNDEANAFKLFLWGNHFNPLFETK